MKKIYLVLAALLVAFCARTQTEGHTWLVSVYNNAVSLPAVKFSPLHPGVQVGLEKRWKEKNRWTLAQNFRLGYFYQRLAHHGIPLYTQVGYKYRFYKNFRVAAYLDAGYIHTFSDVAIYKPNDAGEYERTGRAGKAHATFGYSLILSHTFTGSKGVITPFIQHQFWMMTPFVKTYVPMLPNSAFHVGAYFSINKNN